VTAKHSQKRLDGKKKLIRLTGEMEKDLRLFCRDNRIESESELIRQAIAKYLYSGYEDNSLLLKAVKSLEEKLTETRDMLDVTFRYQRLMHINLLAYNPEIDGELSEAAFKSAVNRHGKFFSSFQESLKADPPFFERLLHRYFSGETEEANGKG
jgi:Arc/MetJ-type ribon-helix-helix transcriptional regulator